MISARRMCKVKSRDKSTFVKSLTDDELVKYYADNEYVNERLVDAAYLEMVARRPIAHSHLSLAMPEPTITRTDTFRRTFAIIFRFLKEEEERLP